jgi:hypothetical protein
MHSELLQEASSGWTCDNGMVCLSAPVNLSIQHNSLNSVPVREPCSVLQRWQVAELTE